MSPFVSIYIATGYLITRAGLWASNAAAPAIAALAGKNSVKPPPDQQRHEARKNPDDDVFHHGDSLLAGARTQGTAHLIRDRGQHEGQDGEAAPLQKGPFP